MWDLENGYVRDVFGEKKGCPVSLAVNKVSGQVVMGTDEGEVYELNTDN